MKKLLVILATFSLALNACNNKSAEKQAEVDKEIIERYIVDNNLDAEEVEGGVFVSIIKDTNTRFASSSSTVRVNYKGYLTSKQVFDQSTSPIEFSLRQVIEGWQIGIPYIPEGGSAILLIPSEKAYGDESVGDIPANSVLVFEVDLLKIID